MTHEVVWLPQTAWGTALVWVAWPPQHTCRLRVAWQPQTAWRGQLLHGWFGCLRQRGRQETFLGGLAGCGMRGCRRLIAGARSSAAFLFKMPVVQEVRHPRSLDFANERKAVLLRTVHGCTWAEVQRQVRNLKGEAPSESLLKRVCRDFSKAHGRRLYKYNK